MASRNRRVVKRAMTRRIATDVRQEIEQAQSVAQRTTGIEHARAQRVLDRFGVGQRDNITQSQHRVLRYWRVYATAPTP
jgi:hypothetical protein